MRKDVVKGLRETQRVYIPFQDVSSRSCQIHIHPSYLFLNKINPSLVFLRSHAYIHPHLEQIRPVLTGPDPSSSHICT